MPHEGAGPHEGAEPAAGQKLRRLVSGGRGRDP